QKWLDIVPIVQWLSIATLWQAFYALSGSLIVAKGASRLGLVWRVSLTLPLAGVAYLSARAGGPVWLAAALARVLTVALLPFYFLVVRRLLGPIGARFAIAVGAPLGCAALMAIAVLGVGLLLRPLPLIAALAIQVMFGAILFAMLVAFFRPTLGREIA